MERQSALSERSGVTGGAPRAPPDIESRLLPVVEDLLFQRGYAGLNIRDVAKVTGMGPATIYKYFQSKEALGLRIIQDQDRRIATAIAPRIPRSGAAKGRWRAFYEALLGYYDQNITVAVIQNVAMPTNTWFLSESQWPVTGVSSLLRELVLDGRRSGELDPDVTDNQIMATHYMHLVREVRLWRSRGMNWKLADRIDKFFPIVWKTISSPAAPAIAE